MHYHYVEDDNGELIDAIEFCSDFCNREHSGNEYAGWNGCYESEFDTVCANCGAKIEGMNGPSD